MQRRAFILPGLSFFVTRLRRSCRHERRHLDDGCLEHLAEHHQRRGRAAGFTLERHRTQLEASRVGEVACAHDQLASGATGHTVDECDGAVGLLVVGLEPRRQWRAEHLARVLGADQAQSGEVHREDGMLRRHQHHGFGQMFEQGAQPRLSRAHRIEFERSTARRLGAPDGVEHGVRVRGDVDTFVGTGATKRVVVLTVSHDGDRQAGVGPLDAADAEHQRVRLGARVDDQGCRMRRLHVLRGQPGEALGREPDFAETRPQPGRQLLPQRIARTGVPEPLCLAQHVALGMAHLVQPLGQRAGHEVRRGHDVVGATEPGGAGVTRRRIGHDGQDGDRLAHASQPAHGLDDRAALAGNRHQVTRAILEPRDGRFGGLAQVDGRGTERCRQGGAEGSRIWCGEGDEKCAHGR